MRWRNTWILLALFALIAAYVWFFERGATDESGDSATAEAAPGPAVLSFDPHVARSVRLARPATGEETLLRYDAASDSWGVVGEVVQPADDSSVSLLVSYLSDLTAQRVLTGTLDSLATYGLDPAEMVVTVVLESGEEAVVEIGAETLTGAYHYARLPDAQEVYTISSYVGDNVARFIDTPPYQPTPTPTVEPTATPSATPTATTSPATAPAATLEAPPETPTPASTAGVSAATPTP